MSVEDLREQGLIILECINGSKAYGLDTPTSDTDIKGVFVLPKETYYGFKYVPQVNNDSNDIVFYELGRFMELLWLNNPNILELLNAPEHTVLYKHAVLNDLDPSMFLSKLCKNTFGKFAMSQIKKARGLNKKIVNPIDKDRKNILSFCHVNYLHGAIPLLEFLAEKNWEQSDCGLVKIPHMRDMYGLYHSNETTLNGIVKKEDANDVCLSSIPKGMNQVALMYFNKDQYSIYCNEYKAYWDWVENRNYERYKNNQRHGRNYDSKNMMHVFRLLDMACEIAKEGIIKVQRPNRDFLLSIKSGEYEYETLLNMANEKQIQMEADFGNSSLPDTPNLEDIQALTFKIRNHIYNDVK